MRTAFFPGAELAAGPDAGLAAHARTAARYALLLARALGIDGENPLRTIERGALLHDIGKAAVPRAILFKRGPLTPFEREVVREHPEVGFQMVAGFGGLNEASVLSAKYTSRPGCRATRSSTN